jgi:hypothetical protein
MKSALVSRADIADKREGGNKKIRLRKKKKREKKTDNVLSHREVVEGHGVDVDVESTCE